MQLAEVNELLNHQITGGAEYEWNCWPDARVLDYSNDYGTASVVYSTKTQTIYEATVESNDGSHWYVWREPLFVDDYNTEAKSRGVDALDTDSASVQLEVAEDWMEKAEAIFSNSSFDKRVMIQLDLSDTDFNRIALLAHESDITFNAMVEQLLVNYMETLKEKGCCGSCSGKCGEE